MTKNFSRVLVTVILFGATQTSWADQAQVYYTDDPSLALQDIKTRSVPIDMDVQQFLDALNLPPLDSQTVWALSTRGFRARPSDKVVVPDVFHPVGKSSDNPWVVTKVALG
jgi:hypothetical protein